jgi:hypothetical protein
MAEPSFTSTLARAKHRWQMWKQKRPYVPQLQAAECDVAAPMAPERKADRESLLDQRLRALRLDPAYFAVAEPTLYRSLQSTCSQCPSTLQCAGDLARGDVQVGHESYCPNGQAIDELYVGIAPGVRNRR